MHPISKTWVVFYNAISVTLTLRGGICISPKTTKRIALCWLLETIYSIYIKGKRLHVTFPRRDRRGVHAQLYSVLTSALDRGRWSMSRQTASPPGTAPVPTRGRWVGPMTGLEGFCRRKTPLPPPWIEPWTFQPVASRCTDYAIPAHNHVLYA
jgi:hypothetical protein